MASHNHAGTGHDDAPKRSRKDDKVDDMAVVGKSILINRPRNELFDFWQDFSNLPSFMENLEKVEAGEDGGWLWIIKAPLARTVQVATRIVDAVPGRSINWQSTEASEIKTTGRIEFADAQGGRGTAVTLEVKYEPPGGDLGRLLGKLLSREPNIQSRQELKRFKMLMEAGEVAKGPDQLKKED